MTTDLAPTIDGETVARVLLHGDLSKLTAAQKVSYYHAVCTSVGLNPLTQPFQYLVLNGKEILYARREATEQLRMIHDVSVTITARELVDEMYVVTARATLPSGRCDENIGAVSLTGLKGESRANGMMKAETKSKRRVTLAICGLGLLDETEVADIPPQAMGAYDTRVPPPLAEAPAGPDDELPEGVVRITRIDSSPTKNAHVTKFFVTVSTGDQFTTINQMLATVAQDACEHRTPVRLETKATKWGTDLVKITAADAPALSFEPPPDAADIPF